MTAPTAGSAPRPTPNRRRWAPVLTLALAAPLIAELGVGSIPVTQLWLLAFFGYVYSAGTLLVRDVVARRGLGLAATLALGTAYGVLEEGVALRSLTSTTLYPVAGWAPRLAGFNTAFSLLVVPSHAVYSIALPIALVDLIFPDRRRTAYLGRAGLVLWAIAGVLGLGVIRLSTVWQDPSHHEAWWRTALEVLVVVALVVWALTRRARTPRPTRVPTVPVCLGLSVVATATYLGGLIPLPGAEHSAFLPQRFAWLAPTLWLCLLLALVATGLRWAHSSAWTPRHTAAVIAGTLPVHTVSGLVMLPMSRTDQIGQLVVLGVELVLGAWLLRRIKHAAPAPEVDLACETTPA